MNCNDIKKTKYILKKGLILYSGNSGKRKILTLDDIFNYIGQRGNITITGEHVLYASSNIETAQGYALSCLKEGFVHKFRVTKNVELWQQDVYEDAERVAECVCGTVKGIYVNYSEEHDEYALCSAHEYLDYISTRKCNGGRLSDEYHVLDKLTASDLAFGNIPE